MSDNKKIKILIQAVAAILWHHGLYSRPIDNKYLNSETILKIKNNVKAISNLLANAQLMIYNEENKSGLTHPLNGQLADLYYNFWKLKNRI